MPPEIVTTRPTECIQAAVAQIRAIPASQTYSGPGLPCPTIHNHTLNGVTIHTDCVAAPAVTRDLYRQFNVIFTTCKGTSGPYRKGDPPRTDQRPGGRLGRVTANPTHLSAGMECQRMRRTRRTESGLTPIEVVVSIVLLSMIAGSHSTVFVTALRLSGTDKERVRQSDDSQTVAAFLVRDAQAARGIDPSTASRVLRMRRVRSGSR